MTRTIDSLVAAYVTGTLGPTIATAVDPSTLHAQLSGRTPEDLIFIVGDAASIDDVVRADEGWGLLRRLGVEVVNLRMAAAPFYLFATENAAARLERGDATQLSLAYYASATLSLDPADAEVVLRPVLGPQAIGSVVRLGSPVQMAQRLLATDDTRLDLIGIYDQEPSTFVQDFVAAYERARPRGVAGLQALRLVVFPTQQLDLEPGQLHVAPGGAVTYALVRYDEGRFFDYDELITVEGQSAGLLTVSKSPLSGPLADSLLVMTNVRRLRGAEVQERLSETLGYAYFAALFQNEIYGNRCAGRSAPLYRAYLFNAHVTDPQNVLKGLVLWSHLALMGTANVAEQPVYEQQARLVQALLQRRMSLLFEPQLLAAQLATGAEELSVRERFSGDVSTLYTRAVKRIRDALAAPSPARLDQLRAARSALVELIARGMAPGCARGGHGLWAANDFDPYFHLALIDAHLTLTPVR